MDCTTNISQYVHRMEESEPLRNYFNSTEDYLLFLYGPKHSHLSLPMTWIYALIFIVGVSGNLLVCLVILKHRNMKTPTNCYLFSLAISDLLVLLFGMPLEVYEMWSNYPFLFGLVGCYFKTAFFETVCFASILIITMVSIERYIAVLHPFPARLKNTQQRALRIIFILWLLSILFSLPNASVHGIKLQYFPNNTEVPGSAICAVVKSMWIYNWIIQLTSLLFYVLPMSIISVLYCLMGLKLRRDRSLEVKDMRMNIKLSSRKSITKMLFVLVIIFGVCWAPFHTDRLFYSFVATWTEPLANIFNLIHVVSGVFFYLSSAVNPIIYHVLSRRFRMAFLSVIFPQCKYWHPKHPINHPTSQQSVFILGERNKAGYAEEWSHPSMHQSSF
ncbi:LOW QUALITY PROTEIN: neuromedin-U receptor 2 [Ahaetulla prasina]|uniref:LOW QUALITY PROTEIN: neuromedin-U receptor 2 n=1 Tax=Ahaetulla prasina TaxID=499056 RepID=UPI0026498801|nr:LOW QUALITY PROTEIN: neuromedin-U receptor 2 [Ahaetulla prasina]